jgi:hypothetical protein
MLAVCKGLNILCTVGNSMSADGGPFVLVDDSKIEQLKLFWYKTHYKICRDLFQLCPPKKNLQDNLDNHLQGLKHCKIMEEAA